MGHTLLTLPLRNKRDAMIARQRTRQLAGLLGYDMHEQARIAAGIFSVAWQILALRSPVELRFHADDDTLRVQAHPRRSLVGTQTPVQTAAVLCLERRLPGRARMAEEDLAFALESLDRITPAHMYEEVYSLNQELLATMRALEDCQAQLNMMNADKTSAA